MRQQSVPEYLIDAMAGGLLLCSYFMEKMTKSGLKDRNFNL